MAQWIRSATDDHSGFDFNLLLLWNPLAVHTLDVPRGSLHYFSRALIKRVKCGVDYVARNLEGEDLDTVELTSETEQRVVAFISNALDDGSRDCSYLFIRRG